MSDDQDLIWCDECGAGVAWKHARRPLSRRRRLVSPLAALCAWLIFRASALHNRLINWADRPERLKYDLHVRQREKEERRRRLRSEGTAQP